VLSANDPWQFITAAEVGNATALAVLGWLGKSLLEKVFQRDRTVGQSRSIAPYVQPPMPNYRRAWQFGHTGFLTLNLLKRHG
jgi:hypothetical protein